MRPIHYWHRRAVLWLLLCLGWCVAPASGQSKLVVRKMANFTLLVPSNQDPTELTGLLESARKRVQEYGLALPRTVVVRIYSTSVQFAQATGLTTSHLAGERNGRLHLQPLPLLLRRPEASRTLQHELVHLALAQAARNGLPRWFNEGIAMVVAGEKQPEIVKFVTLQALQDTLLRSRSYPALRSAYGTCQRLVEKIVSQQGQPAVLAMLRAVANGGKFPERFRRLAGQSAQDWARQWLAKR